MYVAMVVFSYFPDDVRVHREALTIANNKKVFVYSFQRQNQPSFEKVCENIYVNRVFSTRFIRNRSALGYIFSHFFNTIQFFLLLLSNKHLRMANIIHIHNPPDILVIPAFFFKIFFKNKIILDRHEPFAISITSFLNKNEKSFLYIFLSALETLTGKLTDGIIVINHLEKQYFQIRKIKNIAVVGNSFDLSSSQSYSDQTLNSNLVSRSKYGFTKNHIVLLYQGLFSKRRDLDTLLELFVKSPDPRYRLLLLGDGPLLNEIHEFIKKYDLQEIIKVQRSVPSKEVCNYISIADVCLVLAKNVPIYQHYTPNKLFEYLALEKSTVVPLVYNIVKLTESKLPYYTPGSSASLAKAIESTLIQNKEISLENINYVFNINQWENDKKRLIEFYDKISFKGNLE